MASSSVRRRLDALEARDAGGGLSPSLRRWLGWPLTLKEAAIADREDAERKPFDRAAVAADPTIDTEVKQWLVAI